MNWNTWNTFPAPDGTRPKSLNSVVEQVEQALAGGLVRMRTRA
jgi:hypothetical protein